MRSASLLTLLRKRGVQTTCLMSFIVPEAPSRAKDIHSVEFL
jgi:hypothetical protein